MSRIPDPDFVVPPLRTSSSGIREPVMVATSIPASAGEPSLFERAKQDVFDAVATVLPFLRHRGGGGDTAEGGLQLPDPTSLPRGALKPPAGSTAAGKASVLTGNLTDHGGGVLAAPNVVPVYLGDYFKTTTGQQDVQHNDAALADMVRNPGYTGIWKQYGVGQGSTGASVLVSQKSPTSVTKAQVESLVLAQVKAGKLDTGNPETIFNILLPPGTDLQDGANSSKSDPKNPNKGGLGGFHGSVNVGGKEVYYSVIAYSQAMANGVTNGIPFTADAQKNVSITEGHEITEAITDPNVSVAIRTNDDKKLGWYDDTTPVLRADGSPVNDGTGQPRVGKGEIGDIVITNAELAGDNTLATAWDTSDGFTYQKEWSNLDSASEMAPASSPAKRAASSLAANLDAVALEQPVELPARQP